MKEDLVLEIVEGNSCAITGSFHLQLFSSVLRNETLLSNGFKLPNVVKTGTTICGVIYKDGVVLGCDTRTTIGRVVWEKCCEKIYKIQENIYVAGAGTGKNAKID